MNRRREERNRPENHHKILKYYGYDHQLKKMIEELDELKVELEKSLSPRAICISDVRLEMADVSNMMEQMKIIFGDIEEEREMKMRRTIAGIEKGEWVMKGKCRKKPIVIDYIELNQDNIQDVHRFVHGSKPIYFNSEIDLKQWIEYEDIIKEKGMKLKTLESGEGTQIAQVGIDIILKGVDGECYPIKRAIWEKTYDIVS